MKRICQIILLPIIIIALLGALIIDIFEIGFGWNKGFKADGESNFTEMLKNLL